MEYDYIENQEKVVDGIVTRYAEKALQRTLTAEVAGLDNAQELRAKADRLVEAADVGEAHVRAITRVFYKTSLQNLESQHLDHFTKLSLKRESGVEGPEFDDQDLSPDQHEAALRQLANKIGELRELLTDLGAPTDDEPIVTRGPGQRGSRGLAPSQ